MARSQPSDPPLETTGISSICHILVVFIPRSLSFGLHCYKNIERNRKSKTGFSHFLRNKPFRSFLGSAMEAPPKGAAGRRGDRKKSVSKSIKAGLQFPVSRVARYLKKGRYSRRLGTGAPIYLAAVLEYLAAEVMIISRFDSSSSR